MLLKYEIVPLNSINEIIYRIHPRNIICIKLFLNGYLVIYFS